MIEHFLYIGDHIATGYEINLLNRLQLSNRLFEELAMDVYDEVDRRENESS